jgi:hypothetical protein
VASAVGAGVAELQHAGCMLGAHACMHGQALGCRLRRRCSLSCVAELARAGRLGRRVAPRALCMCVCCGVSFPSCAARLQVAVVAVLCWDMVLSLRRLGLWAQAWGVPAAGAGGSGLCYGCCLGVQCSWSGSGVPVLLGGVDLDSPCGPKAGAALV